MKKAIVFGAGNIGRGLIGLILSQAGYHITFVDVVDDLVNQINSLKKYNVEVFDENGESKKILVENISAINSDKNADELFSEIAETDLITTAVGSHILKFVAPNIAKGLQVRFKKNSESLNVIACENVIGGSEILRGLVLENLDKESAEKLDSYVGFPNSSVDRIVPVQKNDEPLLVKVEKFFEWNVDSTQIHGKLNVDGLNLVDNLQAYIERKMFTVNTGHASIAYVAYQKHIEKISDAVKDDDVIDIAWKVWKETGTLLIDKYAFDNRVHADYIETTLKRFLNPVLSDEVIRVARNPIKKLSPTERLTSPANQLLEFGKVPEALVKVITCALKYDYAEDSEAVELQQFIKSEGIDKAITKFTGANINSKLFQLIKSEL